MQFQLGNLLFANDQFFIDGKYFKLSRLKFKILKLLCINYHVKLVNRDKLIMELYHNDEPPKDEPESNSWKSIIYALKRELKQATNNSLDIRSHKGRGYSLELIQ